MSTLGLEISEAQAKAVEKFARLIVRLRLTVPAIMALESVRPLTFVGSQFMHVMAPAAATLVPFAEWDEVARLLEDRRGIEYVITCVENEDARTRKPGSETSSEATP